MSDAKPKCEKCGADVEFCDRDKYPSGGPVCAGAERREWRDIVASLKAESTRLRTALERIRDTSTINIAAPHLLFQRIARAALHPPDNSAPAAAPPPACECPPGVVSSTCKVHGYGYP